MDLPTVMIGSRRVGQGHPVLIVAEAGVNHDGRLNDALQLVDAAAQAGADAVKFQIFRADELVIRGAKTAAYQRLGAQATLQSKQAGLSNERVRLQYEQAVSQHDMLKKLELSHDDFVKIKERCDQCSLLFLATPFGISEVEYLAELGVSAVKIASTDLTNRPLINAAVATGLPLIVSTGASTFDEIKRSVHDLNCHSRVWSVLAQTPQDRPATSAHHEDVSESCDSIHPAIKPNDSERIGVWSRLILLHCVSCYPVPIDALNLRAIQSLSETFGMPSGFSDHSDCTETGGWAVAAGACVLEKHFTLDRSRVGPDHAMSLSPDKLREYVQGVRRMERVMGSGELGMSPLEEEVRQVAGRSVVATKLIPKGTVLTESLLTVKRPAGGIPPAQWDEVLGRRAVREIPPDVPISWDALQ